MPGIVLRVFHTLFPLDLMSTLRGKLMNPPFVNKVTGNLREIKENNTVSQVSYESLGCLLLI